MPTTRGKHPPSPIKTYNIYMKKELINLGAYGDVKPTQCLDTDYYLHRR